MKLIQPLPLALSALLCISSCGERSAPTVKTTKDTVSFSEWIGKNVRVQFRRDALGAAANLPISPNTGSINGAETTIVGELTEIHPSSIVVTENQRPKWIPREVILFVEANP